MPWGQALQQSTQVEAVSVCCAEAAAPPYRARERLSQCTLLALGVGGLNCFLWALFLLELLGSDGPYGWLLYAWCVCVHMRVRVRVCMCVCECVTLRVRVHVCSRVRERVRQTAHACVSVRMCVRVEVCMRTRA